MEIIVIGLFCAILIGCVIARVSILWAIFAGLVIFLIYGKRKGFSGRELAVMCREGIWKVHNILITFLFIGCLTALWRSSACIPTIVCYASRFIHPSIFLMLTFLLCAIVSVLTGTSFGTAATMGVICMSIANSMQIPAFWVGGAILSGVFWGDRCSPMSTSALLVASVTETDLYQNIKNMVRTAIVPTIIVTVIYLLVGCFTRSQTSAMDVTALFTKEFQIGWVCLIPAGIVLVLSILKINIKITMAISAISAGVITCLVQHASVFQVLRMALLGFQAQNGELQGILNGGGIITMIKVAVIVCVASCYAGIFSATGLLNFLQDKVSDVSKKTGEFAATLLISIPISAISCNQTLSIMLTRQMISKLPADNDTKALHLENTVVLISALIPWSIAGQVPLDTVGAPHSSFFSACFLYVLPLTALVLEWKKCYNKH